MDNWIRLLQLSTVSVLELRELPLSVPSLGVTVT